MKQTIYGRKYPLRIEIGVGSPSKSLATCETLREFVRRQSVAAMPAVKSVATSLNSSSEQKTISLTIIHTMYTVDTAQTV